MKKRSPYQVISHQHVTEKSSMLLQLQSSESNASIRRFAKPKYVFIVDRRATKPEISRAIEEIYHDLQITVTEVNTINVKPKPRRMRGRRGRTKNYKKAIVTLKEGDSLEAAV